MALNLIEKIKGLNAVGFDNAFLAVLYGFKKKRTDRRFKKGRPKQKSLPVISPGELLENLPVDGGRLLRFKNASLELRFLTPDLLRVTWEPGVLPVPYAIVKTDWPGAEFTMSEEKGLVRLSSTELTVCVRADGSLSYFTTDGKLLRSEEAPTRQGETWSRRASLKPGEHVYGLGQRNGALNLRGGSFLNWNAEPMGDYGPGRDPIYVCIPTCLMLHEQGSYLIFHENSHRSRFRFEQTEEVQFEGGALRSYVIPGPPERAYDRYTELTGRPTMPPRWALGYHQARWSYLNEAEVREVVQGFQTHRLPLSALHLDIHYMDGYRVFTVDTKRFPDMKALSGELEAKGVKLITILDPAVKADPGYALYKEGKEKGYFCAQPDGEIIHAPVWPGTCAFPDFTDPKVRTWWSAQYRQFVEWGVAGVWHDMNEPAAFTPPGQFPTLPDVARHNLDGRGGTHVEAHNLYGFLEIKAGYEGLKAWRPEVRPWLLSRSGWAGMQAYSWNWTGDTGTNWWALGQNLRLALMLSLSGIPYTGPDIGGFNGDPSAELYVRYFQLASFLPFFRTHSAAFVKRREPWSFGEPTTAIAREFMNLRVRLMPYWYTLAWQANQSGAPLVRPLWWNREGESALLDIDDAFMLGEALLVAPVTDEGARRRLVTLPLGRWIHYWDGKIHEGGSSVEMDAPLERMPLFVREGSLIPMEEDSRLVLHLYVGPSTSQISGLVYSDKGDGYEEGRIDRFEALRNGETWEITRSQEGQGTFPYSGIDLMLHGDTPRNLMVDGEATDFKGNRGAVGEFRALTLIPK